MSDDLNRQIFKEEAYDLLSELEGSLLELEDAPHDMDLVNRVFRALHTIKGSGSMFGFDAIAEFTHEVESVFDMVRSDQLEISTDLVNLAFRSRDHIQKLLDAAETDEDIEPDVRQEILSGLLKLASGESLDDGSASADGPVEDAPEAAADVEAYIIKLIPRTEEGREADRIEPLFEELQKIGEFRIQSHPEDFANEDDALWEVHLDTDKGRDSISDILLFTDLDLETSIELAADAVTESGQEQKEEIAEEPATKDEESAPAKPGVAIDVSDEEETPKIGEILVDDGVCCNDDVDEALKQQKPIGQILKDSGKVTDEQLNKAVTRQSQAKESQTNARKQEAVSSIRVAAEKLDWLVDLVGELVIVQAQISQVISERGDPVLTGLSEELERLSDELRDSTLGIRMLPIGTTFSKFRRLVRDLSAELGKEIVLNTNGAETELDKTVIERLGDPLVHLLRNSIDHGIESPAEREAGGKPKSGMILLSAEHSGGEVLIRITDDGKGIDPDVVRAKGIERGLIAADAELSRKDIFKLIFEPGFSTAKTVTNVSGRGVGMDVVKRAIDSLRGSIDIDSSLGKGTTITIRLPLTLAIIDGLQIQVGDEFYVVPLSLVEECVELNNENLDEDESGQKLLQLRGEIVPYIHLRDFFFVEGEQPSIEQIVITRVEGTRIGIVVDTVIGEHQTVIKSLSRVYKDVEGISGATIKGDGSIALILDVPTLVRRVAMEAN